MTMEQYNFFLKAKAHGAEVVSWRAVGTTFCDYTIDIKGVTNMADFLNFLKQHDFYEVRLDYENLPLIVATQIT